MMLMSATRPALPTKQLLRLMDSVHDQLRSISRMADRLEQVMEKDKDAEPL